MTILSAAPKHILMALLAAAAVAVPSYAQYTVTGKFVYADREFDLNGFTHNTPSRPIRFADVQVMADGKVLASGATDAAGDYSITMPGSAPQTITALCVARSSATPGIRLNVRVATDNFTFGDYYSVASSPAAAPGTGIVQMGTTLAPSDGDAGKAFNIWDVALDGLEFIASPRAAGKPPQDELTLIWRETHSRSGSYYESAAPKYIYVGAHAAYDDTVISHEFGHFMDDVYSKSDSPGGQHFIGDNKQDIRLSWGEGLATFLSSSIRSFKGYPRPDLYVSTDGEQLSFSYEIESLTGNVAIASRTGSTNEVAVTAALWDLVDGLSTDDRSPGVDDDPVERPFSEVWKDLSVYFPTITTSGISIEDFWVGWFSPAVHNGYLPELQSVFASLNGIEFVPDALEGDNAPAIAAPAGIGRIPALESGAKVLINEIDMGRVDAVELYNAGGQEADLSGWKVIARAKGYDSVAFAIPAFTLAPGAFVVLSETSGENTTATLYFDTNVSWANDAEGSCALVDGSGKTKDFIRWGRSKDLPPDGREFTGANPDPPPSGKTLARPLSLPMTGAASDWRAQSPSLGTYNFGAGELHHTFYPAGDVDYLAFNATSGLDYTVETINLNNGAAVVAEILSGDGTAVLKSTDGMDPTKGARAVWTAPASGRYYVRLRRYTEWNFAKFGSYDVRITARGPLTVDRAGRAKYATIAEAVLAARSGDTIEIQDSGTYQESVSITGKNLTIRAVAGQSPLLDGSVASAAPALSIAASSADIEGLRIRGGSPAVSVSSGTVTMTNTSIFRSAGNGIRASGPYSLVRLVNSVVASNAGAGIGLSDRASAAVINSILAGNAGGDVAADATAIATVRNSVVAYPTFAGQNNNIQADPAFADIASDDFHLQGGSPAADRAAPDEAPSSDADGIARNIDGNGDGSRLPDAGAYEYLPPPALASSAVFPQIAIGDSYRTAIVAINPAAKDSAARILLTDGGGSVIPASALGRSGAAVTLPLASLGTARLESVARTGTLSGYARLLSSSPGSGSVLFRRFAGDRVLSEAGVGASTPARDFRIFVDNSGNAYSGYAVANPGAVTANLTLTLRNQDGSTAGTIQGMKLASGHQIAEFAAQRIAAAHAGFTGTLEFASDQPLGAVALRYDNLEQDVFSTIPVLADDAAPVLYFPQIADGGGYRSTFILINPSASAAAVTVEFLGNDGAPLMVPVGGVLKTSESASIPRNGLFTFRTDGTSNGTVTGWVRVRSTVPIGGSSVFQVVSGGRILSEAGVAASPAAPRFTSYVESLGYTESGVAICNPGETTVRAALRLRNSSGEIVASDVVTLPPLGHTAKFFTQWFPDSWSEFQGTLEVVADVPLAAVALRYDNFLADVFATIPVVPIP